MISTIVITIIIIAIIVIIYIYIFFFNMMSRWNIEAQSGSRSIWSLQLLYKAGSIGSFFMTECTLIKLVRYLYPPPPHGNDVIDVFYHEYNITASSLQ